MAWNPPKSPYNLIQEHLHQEPWRLLIACIFCNQTRRHQAEPVLWEFFDKYPDPESAQRAKPDDLEEMLRPLGLWERRAKSIVRFSREYLEKDWEDPSELYGIGRYGSDAWRIFCNGDWDNVDPKDHALNDYHNFLKEYYENYKRESSAAA